MFKNRNNSQNTQKIIEEFKNATIDELWDSPDDLLQNFQNDSEYKKVKIFGTVENPRSATWVYFTITEPDGKTSQVKVVVSDNGNYENYILVCCNEIGQYNVYAEWKGYHIGTVTFEVVENLAEITEGVETVTEESIEKIPNWVRQIFIWYAAEQITESDLLGAIQFLVQQGIIELEK